jgi:hypothetical protein
MTTKAGVPLVRVLRLQIWYYGCAGCKSGIKSDCVPASLIRWWVSVQLWYSGQLAHHMAD